MKARRSKTKPSLRVVPPRPTPHTCALSDPVEWLEGYDPRYAEAFARLSIRSVHDLLMHMPRAWFAMRRIKDVKLGEVQGICGKVQHARVIMTRGRRMRIVEVVLDDDGTAIKLAFFNQEWLVKRFVPGQWVFAVGTVDYARNVLNMHPLSWHLLAGEPPRREDHALHPEYPLSGGIQGRELRALIRTALEAYAHLLPTIVPAELMRSMALMPPIKALEEVHAPSDPEALAAARLSLSFREFFILEAGLALRRRRIAAPDGELRMHCDPELRARCERRFPFKLTKAQLRAMDEIQTDMTGLARMNRLLQGDVGSGKTVVACFAMLMAIANRYQAVLLAPTEILARQHFASISGYLRSSRVRVALLVGGMERSERAEVIAALTRGDIDICVGTHALLEPDVTFARVGTVVIDEQHKFGVRQRSALMAKGRRPHLLVMSATPIPRSLSLTVFGDLDLSVIDELPPGRKPVVTSWVPARAREKTYAQIHEALRGEASAYVILPLVESNPELELTSATELYEELANEFADVGIELVHGQLAAEEKTARMERFRAGKIRLLIATVVVEVGVDVPAATIMVIEHAERFGLSQLHQLRGRIGRGEAGGTLYLFAEPRTPQGKERLKVFCSTTDGFAIAEADLRIRGFGDFLGTRQSGMPKLRIGDPVQDLKLLARAKKEAFARIDALDEREVIDAVRLTFGGK